MRAELDENCKHSLQKCVTPMKFLDLNYASPTKRYVEKRYLRLILTFIPDRHVLRFVPIYGKLMSLKYAGNQVICPCCNGHFRNFMSLSKSHYDQICPKCLSFSRHRLISLYLKNKTNIFSDSLKVLHIAPEYFLYKTLRSSPHLEYISADLDSSLAMVKMDITSIQFEDNTFDVVLCSHVLEHIIDDQKAMRELFRVLKPGGWAILQSPIDLRRDKTFEDFNIVSPDDREKAFWQSDHVRLYGRDYKDRLEAAGFTVKIDDYVKTLGIDMVKKYGLQEGEDIYFCIKEEQKVV